MRNNWFADFMVIFLVALLFSGCAAAYVAGGAAGGYAVAKGQDGKL